MDHQIHHPEQSPEELLRHQQLVEQATAAANHAVNEMNKPKPQVVEQPTVANAPQNDTYTTYWDPSAKEVSFKYEPVAGNTHTDAAVDLPVEDPNFVTDNDSDGGLLLQLGKSRVAKGVAAATGIGVGMIASASAVAAAEKPAAYEAAQAPKSMERLAGVDRIDTANKISQERFPDGKANSAILVNGWSVPDSMSAGPTSAAFGATVILAQPKVDQDRSGKLDPRALAEIKRATANNGRQPAVLIIGGTSAISPAIENQLKAAGMYVERWAGPDRYSTAVAVMRKVFGTAAKSVFFSNGNGQDKEPYADALTAAAAAATNPRIGGVQMGSSPMLPTNGGVLTPPVQAYWNEIKAGYPSVQAIAVGDAAAQAVPNANFKFTGGTPSSRAVDIATRVAPGYNRGVMGFSVTGGADALALPGLLAYRGGYFPVSGSGPLDPSLKAFIQQNAQTIQEAVVAGGPNAVSDDVVSEIRQAAGIS